MTRVKWNLRYFCLGIVLTFVEVFIALYVHDDFIRPIFGDVLVVFVLYCFLNSVCTLRYRVFYVTLFACFVELLQYIHIVDLMGIKQPVIRVLIGTTFDWMDIGAYVFAGMVLWCLEYKKDFIQMYKAHTS